MGTALAVFLTLLVAYVVLCYFIYQAQEKLIFEPTKLPRAHEFSFNHPFKEHFLKTKKSEINILRFTVENPKGCVLYHHGNARDMSDWASNYKDFVKNGYDVVFYDYRGYGKSTGVLSEKALHKDAKRVYNFLLRYYSGENIIQYGRSLGTGIATKLASIVHSKLLILETPYYSMRAMASKTMPFVPVSLLLKFPIRTDWFIKGVTCPIYIFHGMKDELVPFKHSLRLRKLIPEINLIAIQHGMHNNLPEFEEYQDNLKKILDDFVR